MNVPPKSPYELGFTDLRHKIGSFEGQINDTGLAQLLQNQHRTLIEDSQTRQIENLNFRNRCLSEQLHKSNAKLEKYEAKEKPVPTKVHWWNRFFHDPIWEIFKRPQIKNPHF